MARQKREDCGHYLRALRCVEKILRVCRAIDKHKILRRCDPLVVGAYLDEQARENRADAFEVVSVR